MLKHGIWDNDEPNPNVASRAFAFLLDHDGTKVIHWLAVGGPEVVPNFHSPVISWNYCSFGSFFPE